MITPEEMVIFIKDNYRLIIEYKNCSDQNIRKQIYEEILLMTEIIDPDNEPSYRESNDISV